MSVHIVSLSSNEWSALSFVFRRYHAWQKHCQYPVGILMTQHLEHHAVAGLQFTNGVSVVFDGADRRSVHFGNDVPLRESDVFREARGIHFGYEHALLRIHSHAVCAVWSQFLDVQAELSWR